MCVCSIQYSLSSSVFPSLEQAELLFDASDSYTDNLKKKSALWPLQNVLLMLCPVSVLGVGVRWVVTMVTTHSTEHTEEDSRWIHIGRPEVQGVVHQERAEVPLHQAVQ